MRPPAVLRKVLKELLLVRGKRARIDGSEFRNMYHEWLTLKIFCRQEIAEAVVGFSWYAASMQHLRSPLLGVLEAIAS
jgi:hypothetical protein